MKIFLLLSLTLLFFEVNAQNQMEVTAMYTLAEARERHIELFLKNTSEQIAPEELSWLQKREIRNGLFKLEMIGGLRDTDSAKVAGKIDNHVIREWLKTILTEKQKTFYLKYNAKLDKEEEEQIYRGRLISLRRYISPLTLTEEQKREVECVLNRYFDTWNEYKKKYPAFTYHDLFICDYYYPNKLYEEILMPNYKKILTEEQYKNYLAASQAEREKVRKYIIKYEELVKPGE